MVEAVDEFVEEGKLKRGIEPAREVRNAIKALNTHKTAIGTMLEFKVPQNNSNPVFIIACQ